VEYNLDALQLFNREQRYAREGCHISAVIISNTGSLTPQYIVVFQPTLDGNFIFYVVFHLT